MDSPEGRTTRWSQTLLVLAAVVLACTGSVWAGDQWQEINPANAPPPRIGHTAAELNGKLYIHGGQGDSGQVLSDLWAYDPAANR